MNETISVSANQRRVGLANKAMLNGSKNIDTSLESIASVDSLWIKKCGHGTKLFLFSKMDCRRLWTTFGRKLSD